jgi:hypothetical protein
VTRDTPRRFRDTSRAIPMRQMKIDPFPLGVVPLATRVEAQPSCRDATPLAIRDPRTGEPAPVRGK